uniref:SCAN box domain-containing protein n=1 Tax=Varanus komodoensis TaxID=61221 RepID=A0A8D2LBX8_VARKO
MLGVLLIVIAYDLQPSFPGLEGRDREDDGKVKTAILQGGDATNPKKLCQHFRHLYFREAEGPREAFEQLHDLCCQWLMPERCTKEQVLELLILEQFLAVLPPDMQNWVREAVPDSCYQAVALAEEFLLRQQEAEGWEGRVKSPMIPFLYSTE